MKPIFVAACAIRLFAASSASPAGPAEPQPAREDCIRALVLLVGFPDLDSPVGRAYAEKRFFQDLDRYIREMSYGTKCLSGDVSREWRRCPGPSRVRTVRPGEKAEVLPGTPGDGSAETPAVKMPLSEKAHYLFENRQPIGCDRHLPGKGMLVMYADDEVPECRRRGMPSNHRSARERCGARPPRGPAPPLPAGSRHSTTTLRLFFAASSVLGTRTSRTPSLKVALALSVTTSAGRWKVRTKEP